MNSDIQLFNYGKSPVRTVEKDGGVWFVAKDICDILEIKNSRDATSNLDDDEKDDVAFADAIGRMQSMTVISESGLYTLLLRSNKEEAKPFRRWVTHDVIPQIHRTGSYNSSHNNSENISLKRQELNIEGAKILQLLINAPSFPITDESKAVIAHEVFKLVTGHEYPPMLPKVTEKMLSATDVGNIFGVSSKKIGKIAKAHGLKAKEGETNEFGTWIRTKSPYSSHECPQFVYNDNAINWFKEHKELLA